MRVDVLTIFPDYLAPLRLSLLGRAQADGLMSVHVHDLRNWTSDRHRTVDDAPYGGGAGMVMRPEPWGEASTRCWPTPAGRRCAPAGRAHPGRASAWTSGWPSGWRPGRGW